MITLSFETKSFRTSSWNAPERWKSLNKKQTKTSQLVTPILTNYGYTEEKNIMHASAEHFLVHESRVFKKLGPVPNYPHTPLESNGSPLYSIHARKKINAGTKSETELEN